MNGSNSQAATGAAASSHHNNRPPTVPLVLRVGVTGHRPDPNKDRPNPDVSATRLVIAEVLKIIQSAFAGVAQVSSGLFAPSGNTPPAGSVRGLRVISALAEGADQWVADEALKLGFELQCALPFERTEYRKDFTDPVAGAEYERLLGLATAVLELDGKVDFVKGVRIPDSRSYEAVGRAVLNQSDLLIAIWDGQNAHGRGGTGQVLREALQRGIPVIWIPWGTPGPWRLQLPMWHLMEELSDMDGDASRLMKVVRELLLPPETCSGYDRAEDLRERYFNEEQKRWNVHHGWWQLFRNVVCGEIWKLKALIDCLCFKAFRVPNFFGTAED